MSAAIRLLAGKTAAITGGTTGIGRAITLEYLRQGANVAVNHLGLSKDEPLRMSLIEEAARLSKEAPAGAPTGQLLELAGDVTDPKTGEQLVAQAVERWGQLDIFVANAGIFKASSFLDIEKEMFDTSFRVNVNGAFYACQAAARQMVAQGKGGSIIGISSISALLGGGQQVHYTPTKAALLSMTQSMAIALAKDKIRVNALLPGTIHTQLADNDMANEEKRKYLEHRIPWGRVGKPEDLAGPAVFLATDKMSGFVTGAQLLVDGGIFLSGQGKAVLNTTDEPRSFTRGRLSRGKGLRRTTGCLTCRRRRVKCDEVKPRCGGCTRKKARCEYAKIQAGTKTSPARDATTPKSPTFEQQEDQSRELSANDIHMPSGEHVLPIESPQPEETVNIDNGDEGRHANTQIIQSPQNSLGSHGDYGNRTYPHLDSIVYGLPSPAQLPYHPMSMAYGSSPDASLTLKWLDLLLGDAAINYGPLPEPFPDPGGTNIFGNSAIQSPTTLGDNSVSHTGDYIARLCEPHTIEPRVETRNAYIRERIASGEDQVREKDQVWQALEPINLQTQELILFRHFTDHISQWMDLFEPQKPFGSLVPHLALHNVGLMNAILALSARHLDIMNRDTPTYAAGFRPTQDDTIGYYYKTLHYCQEAMQYDGYKTSLELLASAFIISAYEMLDGSNTDWEKHLKGVFWIQRSQTIHGHSDGLRQAVWWAWLCQDVWAAFREKRRPFTFWRPNRPLADLNPSELAARAVYNFAHVVRFCARDDASNTPDYVAVKTQEADLLSRQLDYWASYLTSEFQPLPIVASGAEKNPFPQVWVQPPFFAVAMQVYYCSRILLDLHRPCSGGYEEYLGKQRILKRWAGIVCRIAKALNDHASSVLSSQCVFIAGMVVEDPEQRSAILDILDTCSRRAGWPGYSLGRELKEIWRD
ncbi:uncharacterized protein BKA55DRAFT_587823 [Fusarium redolens]|uniref:Zn(2)-C6 fungal-type domain-containing protein n=1 Tax=Fusarium redolens TaxID=48865 RepID=A0A9P9KV59_FUSRE|nr:uncharacterized protein BKA55DRAFT_587823 [Fusarium redolens]KAH7268968.1 hypothetical protein BKA55DRAFT_587823 [Fusarium redolens]